MSETTYSQSAENLELSPLAKKYLQTCHKATLVSPLEMCRIMQEDATERNYTALLEVETYLINE